MKSNTRNLDRNKLEDCQISSQMITPHFLDRNLDKNYPIFKPTEVGKHKLKCSNDPNELIQTLTNKIAQLDLLNKASTSNSNTKFVNVIEEITLENVDQIQAIFEE